jgi:phosphoribosylformylglycinamidine (FGAM) synthase-like amidotransferase family enzyme
VVFRYAAPEGNPNGSARDIAGVLDARGTTCGLMPHPERASERILGSDDGLLLLRSVVESVAASTAPQPVEVGA